MCSCTSLRISHAELLGRSCIVIVNDGYVATIQCSVLCCACRRNMSETINHNYFNITFLAYLDLVSCSDSVFI